jgi:putative transposase
VPPFFDLEDAQEKLDQWRKDYNSDSPYGALGEMTPAEFANKQRTSKI